MKLKIAKIVGPSTLSGWSQVHTFIPQEKEKIEKRGQLLAVMNLTSLSFGTEIVSAGKELISRLHELYYGELEEKPFFQLKNSVEKVFYEAKKEAVVEIVAGAVVGNILYLAAGGGKIFLSREGKIAKILEGNGEGVETASGYLQKGDIFLLGSKKFFEVVSEEILKTALTAGSVQLAVETLAPMVLGKEESLAAAVLGETEVEAEIAVEKEKEISFPPKPVLIEETQRKEKRLKLEEIKRLFLEIKRKITTPPPEKPKKSFFTVALILLLLLGVSMVFGTKERKRQETERKIREVLEEVRAKKEEGEAILSLNPTKARETLKEAEEILKQIGEKKLISSELEQIRQKLQSDLNSILQEHEAETKLFFDLELIKKGAVGTDFNFSGGQLIVLDRQNLVVYRIDVADKKSAILAGGKEIEEARQIASFWPKVFILGNEGIYQIKENNLSLVIKKDKEWQETFDLGIFGDNLYLLDKNMIWVYFPTEGGFSAKKAWLKEETDFSETLEMAINGAIWIFKNQGKIEEYLRGVKIPFGVVGLDGKFSSPVSFYTSPEEEYLYILDKGNSRIVVLTKTGEYYSQYKNPQISNVQKLVVSEKEGKIFLLEGSKIYQIEIKGN